MPRRAHTPARCTPGQESRWPHPAAAARAPSGHCPDGVGAVPRWREVSRSVRSVSPPRWREVSRSVRSASPVDPSCQPAAPVLLAKKMTIARSPRPAEQTGGGLLAPKLLFTSPSSVRSRSPPAQRMSSPLNASSSSLASAHSYTSVPTHDQDLANSTLSPAGSTGSEKMGADSTLEHEKHDRMILPARQRSAQRCARPGEGSSQPENPQIANGRRAAAFDSEEEEEEEALHARVEQTIADTQALLSISSSLRSRITSPLSPASGLWSPKSSPKACASESVIVDPRPLFDFSPSPGLPTDPRSVTDGMPSFQFSISVSNRLLWLL